MKKLTSIIACLALPFYLAASQPEMADVMRSNGKIYVVVATLATIFAGILGFLLYIDRKLKKLENEN